VLEWFIKKNFRVRRWESVKHVQLYCERLDIVRIVKLRRLTFLNGLCGSLWMKWFCQCYSWYRRVKKFTKLCNEYNIVGSSQFIFDVSAKFRAVCESWLSLISCIILDIDRSVCQSVFLHFFVFICLPEWWINVYIMLTNNVLSRIRYAVSVWSRFMSAGLKGQVNSFLKRA